MERATGSSSCAGTGPVAGQYRHNGLNQRTWKLAGGQQSRFVYGPGGELLMETNASTGQSKAYLWFNGQVVALQMNGTSTVHAVYSDHLARPFKVVDATQTTRWSARLKAFDRQVTLDQIGGLNLGFAGQYYDNESGLWQNWHRFYDGTTGRYTQSDPIGLAGGMNTYAYVGGNSVSFIDPSGLAQCDIDAAVQIAAREGLSVGEGMPKVDIPAHDRAGGKAQIRNQGTHIGIPGRDGYMHLRVDYLAKLDSTKAAELLDTVIHEALHFSEPWIMQGADNDFDHKYIEKQSERLTAKNMRAYNKLRAKLCGCKK